MREGGQDGGKGEHAAVGGQVGWVPPGAGYWQLCAAGVQGSWVLAVVCGWRAGELGARELCAAGVQGSWVLGSW